MAVRNTKDVTIAANSRLRFKVIGFTPACMCLVVFRHAKLTSELSDCNKNNLCIAANNEADLSKISRDTTGSHVFLLTRKVVYAR